ncbi:sex hormone-binding globulin [Elgaria multicarinata webbii]|uniref:sex hormone-binding globulin n=1 Tax=Elgaria multicarinata webbii TaxID=159646 RepID=UPI002FCCC744
MFSIVAWLLLLMAPGSPWETGEVSEGNENRYYSKSDQCFQSLKGEAHALNLGQRWGDSYPAATMLLDLESVTSATSFFDFRTLDPEGLIFYGDTNPSVDWFILALRQGKLEMQIHNNITKITVSGGQRLNDGRWHRILVKNEGHTVLLELDGEDYLTLNHVSHSIIEEHISLMRIGVGGLLIPMQELLVPLNTAMDGCIRHWNWLNKTSEWQEAASLEDKGIKGCFPTIRPGSFFPGDGLATFSLSALPTGLNSASGSWSLTVEMWVKAALQSATLMAVSAPRQTPVFRLDVQHTDLVLQVGNRTTTLPGLLPEGCQESHLLLRFAPTHLAVVLEDDEILLPALDDDVESLQQLWLDKKGDLVIGGLPGQKLSVPAQEGHYFRGCLRGIKVQGQELDFDSAQFRSNSIWAHSCPGGDGGKISADLKH